MASYALLITASQRVAVQVGRLGLVSLEPGGYAYVGSARRALDKRLARYLRREKKLRWHIDYLLAAPGVGVREVWSCAADQECAIVQAMLALEGVFVPRRGLGSSDCRICPSHFLRLDCEESALRRALRGLGMVPARHLTPRRPAPLP